MSIRNIIYSIVIIILLVLLAYPRLKQVALIKGSAGSAKAGLAKSQEQGARKMEEKKPLERVGERIVYDVRLAKVSMGRATFSHLPRTELNGRQVSFMNFQTKLARFNDLEKIYSDPETYLPLKVERSISNWPFSEKISEFYDQEKFTLTIAKDGRAGETVIKKDAPIHNAVMLPFYVRGIAKLSPGWEMSINLPNQKFRIKLIATENISVSGKSFSAYRFESDPRRFEIWISADELRIPLKIKGAGGLGYTLIMKEYSPPQAATPEITVVN